MTFSMLCPFFLTELSGEIFGAGVAPELRVKNTLQPAALVWKHGHRHKKRMAAIPLSATGAMVLVTATLVARKK